MDGHRNGSGFVQTNPLTKVSSYAVGGGAPFSLGGAGIVRIGWVGGPVGRGCGGIARSAVSQGLSCLRGASRSGAGAPICTIGGPNGKAGHQPRPAPLDATHRGTRGQPAGIPEQPLRPRRRAPLHRGHRGGDPRGHQPLACGVAKAASHLRPSILIQKPTIPQAGARPQSEENARCISPSAAQPTPHPSFTQALDAATRWPTPFRLTVPHAGRPHRHPSG
jgi:hypothetical protein